MKKKPTKKHWGAGTGYKDDCPKCSGFGGYYMTNSDYEEPIQCICNLYEAEAWEILKKRWINDGW